VQGDTYANDALGANELDQLVRYAPLRIALAVCLVVAQVTDVAGLVGGGAVVFAVGVDCTPVSLLLSISSSPLHIQPPILLCNSEKNAVLEYEVNREGTDRLTVRPSRGAPIRVVAKSMNMHATLSVGVVARDIP
jgi:hypothetical protein